jgi:hypothetical protein
MITIKQLKDYARLFMTADELSELRSYVNSNEFHEMYSKKYQADESARLKKFKAEKVARQERKKKLETEVYPYLREYCKNWIKPGDIIRFEGAKGGGVRKVVEITNYDTIIGLVVSRITKFEPQLTGYSSENSFDKLIEVYKHDLSNDKDGSKCWFNRKSIVNFIKSKQNES